MKTLRLQLIIALVLSVGFLWPLASRAQMAAAPISTPILTMPVYTLNVAPIRGANRQTVGVTGQTTYFYWAVTNYQVGSVVSRLGEVRNANATLSSGNYVLILPYAYPPGITGIDILRTTTDQAPTGACNCAVSTGVTSGTVSDQSNSLSSYTVATFNENTYALTLTAEVLGTNTVHWILRQGIPWPGTEIADLSAAGTLPTTFASLPTCAAAFQGNLRSVTDSTTNTWGATITGSGADAVLAYCDGTNWTVAAK